MERRDFLGAFFKPASEKKEAVKKSNPAKAHTVLDDLQPFTGTINPYTGSWTENEVIHLLKRLTFGAPVEEINYFADLSFNEAVDTLLNTVNDPAVFGAPLKTYTTDPATPASDPDWAVPAGRTWVNNNTAYSPVSKDRRDTLKAWWLNTMINQPRSVEEKMILFWSNHVTVEFSTAGTSLMNYQYLQLLRKHALGDFKQLIKEVTLNPAMLLYLNGYQNTKVAPDENYGRELQELFTVGKDTQASYTEDDVKAASRVLTGYYVLENQQTAYQVFSLNKHDTNPKQFSSFYNNTVINRPPDEAQLELDDMLTMIFSKQEVSKYICRRLYRYFVYQTITPEIEQSIIVPLAETFRNNNYQIKPVLSQLFKSEHFFDALQFGDMVKSPVDFLVGMIRECALQMPPAANPQLLYKHLTYLATNFLPSIDEAIGEPNNVSGFLAYYQTPFFDKLWVSTDTLIKRRSFSDTMLNTGYSNGGFKTMINPVAIAARMSNPADPDLLITDLNKYFLRRQLSQSLRDTIKAEILLTGQTNDNYWTSAWNDYINTPADLKNFSVVNNRLKSLLQYLFSTLEEYQLM